MDLLSVSDRYAIKPNQISTVISPELFQIKEKSVKLIDGNLLILNKHIRTVVDRYLNKFKFTL